MKGHLIFGIIEMIFGLAFFILCIIQNRTDHIIRSLYLVVIGLGFIATYISDKKQHKKKLAEFAEKWGTKDE